MSGDLSKQDLYEGVKTLIETDAVHVHLPQQKLFTLFSVGFQYMLFESTRKPGAYIIRVEDGYLAEKLAKKSKDPSTRKFMQQLLVNRKFKYEKSFFYLDYFHLGSWNLTSELPRDKVKAALIVKNTSSKPMMEIDLDGEADTSVIDTIKNHDYLKMLMDFVPRTITIAFEETFDGTTPVSFPFIKKEKEKTVSGVTINTDLEWDD
ncbi:hypothetical protein DOM21_08160 [Bacteriovorax stolpii]|uniref:Uncharacterized protein n=1 Tax=Bacteriovorax stolpii TaxID=960 RepID=A0A2K9NSU1_BACTC|nr:hypothetical protein [Bacteriovorax stolpii]AUN98591.1 hypothetical protein C0V70_10860 [Bacteriovorax stolpii]QDK41429.1 hypothetical protein DOM21_08160 [Bacteriovorax stolpii]TDP55904.1 hypothetical protein C8D79_0961 [Bacteriovorax stolpii]